MEFPELRVAGAEPPVDWTLRLADARLAASPGSLLGRDELAAGIYGELRRTAAGLRIAYDDSGTFDIESGGGVIAWSPREGCDMELARVDILGRVLSLAAYEQGLFALHGSAVALDAGAIGFLAPKGSGKSTLAMSLVARGARLMTDDTLPVDPHTAMARPGVHSVRLWDDSAGRFAALGESRIGLSDKHAFDLLPEGSVERQARPLLALYEIVPIPMPDTGEEVRRERLAAPAATIALMRHSKLGTLLGGAEAMEVFGRCAAIAERVAVYELRVARNLEGVDSVAATIAAWHS